MEHNYILKHKEIPVIGFILNDEEFTVEKINEIYDEKRMPFCLEKKDEIHIIRKLDKWIEKRGISDSRSDYGDYVYGTNAGSSRALSVGSLGLNLTDHYWIHKEEFNFEWKKLNFFDNNFKKLVIKRIFPQNKEEDTSNIHPNFSVDGAQIKEWVFDGKDRILVKEGRTKLNQEPFNEVIASKILSIFNIEHVGYDLKTINDRKVCVCKCMVDKENEFITASYVFESEKDKNKNPFKQYVEICEKNGIKDTKERMTEMIILDFLIGNEDRHKRNFGIIRNADTLEWLKIAPIFDNGNSLFFASDIKGKIKDNIDSYCKWYVNSNAEKLRYMIFPEWYDFKKSKEISEIVYSQLKLIDNISKEKLSKIIKIIEDRRKELEKILKKIPKN